MAELYIQNSLNYNKAVKFNITLRHFVVKGEKGDQKWILEIGTTHKDKNGNTIPSKKIYNVSANNLDEVIEENLATLASGIDWLPLIDDKEPPYIYNFSPSGDNVLIGSSVNVTIKEVLPSAGIDLSNMKVTLNNSMVDFDITNEVNISGDPYEYNLKWNPTTRIYKRYNE